MAKYAKLIPLIEYYNLLQFFSFSLPFFTFSDLISIIDYSFGKENEMILSFRVLNFDSPPTNSQNIIWFLLIVSLSPVLTLLGWCRSSGSCLV